MSRRLYGDEVLRRPYVAKSSAYAQSGRIRPGVSYEKYMRHTVRIL